MLFSLHMTQKSEVSRTSFVHVSKQVIPHRLLAEGIFGRSLISQMRSSEWMDPHLLSDTDFIPGAAFFCFCFLLHNHPIYPDLGPALGLPYAP